MLIDVVFFAYLLNGFLDIVIVVFFKGCQVKSKYSKSQPMTDKDGKD